LIASLERFLIQIYLLLGYMVVSPDYEGPDSAFPVGRLEGKGVLDGMRAVNNFALELGLETANPMIVGTGYSGGAVATGWAAAMHPNYAPELNVVGWSMGGTPANLSGVVNQIDGTIFAGFLPSAIVGLSAPSTYGATLDPLIDSVVTEKGKAALAFSSRQCAVLSLLRFAGQDLQDFDIQSLGKELLHHPIVAEVLEDCIIGVDSAETPTVPTFVYHAIKDEIIPYTNASSMVDRWCDAGADVKFTTYAAGGHATTLVLALPAIFEFVDKAFAGTTGYSGCTTSTELTNTLDPLALGVDLEPILVNMVNGLILLGEVDENLLNNLGILAETIAPP
jgi:pimeloyl-ACP methyl ester carboxylesterase